MKSLIRFATRFIPRPLLQRFAPVTLKFISFFLRGSKFEDPISGISYRRLLPYGRITNRENALAPDSMSLERHRLIWLYLQDRTNFFRDRIKFLHIAPEYCFLERFRGLKNLDYTTADLDSPWADVKMDVHNIPFGENTFDAIMCNHVLEHVENDIQVMKEFHRVMKPGGWGIFQVPIDSSREQTLEDPSVTDPNERERLFGQRDHVRSYGRDFAKRLRSAGFEVTEDNYVNALDRDLVKKYALPAGEIVYFCRKPV
jgi:SAM-dependent methyltransferase